MCTASSAQRLGDGEDFETINKMHYETVDDLYNIQTSASVHAYRHLFLAVMV
jgi:hypothetical protein